MKDIRVYHIFIAFSTFLYGCAQVVAPTGGPKDVTPPKVIDYSPGNKSANFKAKKIDITFNKYIQLKDLSKQFIVSPPLRTLPVPQVKGKKLEISLVKDTLQDSTTYTFNFGNAVCDLNEGNQLKNFQYVFSTGSYVDSLSLSGKAVDAFTHDPVKEGLVLLYTNLEDSTPYKKPPSYCGQTDDNGNYKIDNLKPGLYKVLALSKGSGDYLYHPYSQSIAFKTDTLNLQKKDTANLFLFTEVQPKLKLMKSKPQGKGEILMIFNKPADSLHITPLNLDTSKSYQTLMQYSPTSDSLTYWLNYPQLDSLRFIVSRNKTIMDTAVVFSIPGGHPKQSKKKEKPPALQLTLNLKEKAAYDYHLPISIQFATPVINFELSKISLTQRKDTVKFDRSIKTTPYSVVLPFVKPLISDSSYHFSIMPGAFTDFFGSTNDTIKVRFTVQEQSYFGTLLLNLSFTKGIRKSHYIIQLLDNSNNVFRQDTVSGNKSIFYDGLPPALYGIKVIEDANNNGKWDCGNFLKNIQPENVFYYPEKINVRSGWDVIEDWKVK